MFEITPILNEKSDKPLYIQIYEFIREQIETEKIPAGTRLPSRRKLATYLHTSENTIENALSQLLAEGYVTSKPRVGLFVTVFEEFLRHPVASTVSSTSTEVLQNTELTSIYDFNQGHVDLEHFPFQAWKKISMQSLQPEQKELFLGGHPQGEYGLRKEIADYLFQSRGVQCDPEQITIGAGTQYLLGIISKWMGPGSVCAMEEPGFHRSRETFLTNEIKVVPIDVEADGINVNQIKETMCDFTYITPSHQFPTGGILSIQKRISLLEWARDQQVYIIEDDYDGEFRYQGKPIPSLQGLDQHERVIYLGTFSKAFIPSLRISYVVLPQHFIRKHIDDIHFLKQTVSRLHQHSLELFMKEGHWGRHLNKMRTVYRRKQKTLKKVIQENMGNHVTMIGTESGLHILLQVHIDRTEEELIESAKKYSVKVYPSSIYFHGKKQTREPVVLLGFGGLTEKQIESGIQLLNQAWFG